MDADDDAAPPPELTPGEQPKDVFAAESLLTLATARVPRAGLSWHYRCQHESLIAFSNHAMYAGDLMTIPSTATESAPSAIKWVAVPSGTYTSGANPEEAAKVVDVLAEVLARDPAPTVGVITFNLKQKKIVQDAIDIRKASDPRFATVWAKALEQARVDERPFIKNLESVQGDERDVIVFSLGHAPVEKRSKSGVVTRGLRANFGPLGLRGGERRLNVAVSRAKRETFIVASFEPQMLKVNAAKNAGPRLFKAFVEYAYHASRGESLLANRKLDEVRERKARDRKDPRASAVSGYEPIAVQLAMALDREGVPYVLDVGVSEFRVPLAIVDPARDSAYALAILCDEGQERLTAFDRHVHRPAVLLGRGWKVLHVTSAAWRRRGPAIVREILELVPGARGAARRVRPQEPAAIRSARAPAARAGVVRAEPAEMRALASASAPAPLRAPRHPVLLVLETRLPKDQLRAIEIMLDHEGSMSADAFSASMDLVTYRVSGFIAKLQETINADGGEVLKYDASLRELRLDIGKLELAAGRGASSS